MAVVVAGRIDAPTGGSVYNRRLAESLRESGWIVDVSELDDSFPNPTAAALEHASDVLAAVPSGRWVLVDGLAYGAMPDVVEHAAARLRLVPLVHLPLAAAVGLEPGQAARFVASERRALAVATLVVVTGPAAVPLMDEWGLAAARTVVIEPGTDRAPVSRGSGGAEGVQLLTVATLNPGKGHTTLIEALATIRDLSWRLTCVGSMNRHPSTLNEVRAALSRLALGDRVRLLGEQRPEDLAGCYDRSDVFVLASLRETYGMAVAEALARGLPVVATRTGAIPALVGAEAGIVVPPGDGAALADALRRIVADGTLRERCAAGARRVRETLPDWTHAAGRLAAALHAVDSHG